MNPEVQQELKETLFKSRAMIEKEPDDPQAYYDHAMICNQFALWWEAAEALEKAHRLDPECPIISRLWSIVLMKIGNFRLGLKHFERRFEYPLESNVQVPFGYDIGPRIRDRYNKPYWDGKASLKDKTLLIFNEGGHGDLIMNLRYLPVLKEMGATLIVEAKVELVKLLEKTPYIHQVIPCGPNSWLLFFQPKFKHPIIEKVDYCMSLHSAHYFLDPDLDKTPQEFPYLFPQPTDCEAVKVIRECEAGIKLGIVWAGNEGHGNDNRRSTHKRNFKPLLNIEGVQLFGMQKGNMRRSWYGEMVDLMEGDDVNCIDIAPLLKDFNDSALALNELDGLVSVDTSVVHLAGAIDVPVFLILPSREWAEWRWQKKWYKAVTPIYQTKDGDWAGLFEKLAQDISKSELGRLDRG